MPSTEKVSRLIAMVTFSTLVVLTGWSVYSGADLYLEFSAVLYGALLLISLLYVGHLGSNNLVLVVIGIGVPVGSYGIWLAIQGITPLDSTPLALTALVWLFAIAGSDKSRGYREDELFSRQSRSVD